MYLVYSEQKGGTLNGSFKIIILFKHGKIGRFYLRRELIKLIK